MRLRFLKSFRPKKRFGNLGLFWFWRTSDFSGKKKQISESFPSFLFLDADSKQFSSIMGIGYFWHCVFDENFPNSIFLHSYIILL